LTVEPSQASGVEQIAIAKMNGKGTVRLELRAYLGPPESYGAVVITGSFNFTKGAEHGNAENLESRLSYHLRCLREDATDPELTGLERLALVRDRARWIREIRQEMDLVKVAVAEAGDARCRNQGPL
jgi:hypothetical protein